MPCCVVYGCGVKAQNKDVVPPITFHKPPTINEVQQPDHHCDVSFPLDEDERMKWVAAVGRENWKPTKTSRICSKHFKDIDFDRSSPFVTKLKKGVVPSVFDRFPQCLTPKEKQVSNGKRKRRNKTITVLHEGESLSRNEQIKTEMVKQENGMDICDDSGCSVDPLLIVKTEPSNAGETMTEQMVKQEDASLVDSLSNRSFRLCSVGAEPSNVRETVAARVMKEEDEGRMRIGGCLVDPLSIEAGSSIDDKSAVTIKEEPVSLDQELIIGYPMDDLSFPSTSSASQSNEPEGKNGIFSLSREKRFACDVCDYRAAWPNVMRDHLRTHTGEKPFACDECEYSAATKRLLTLHKRKHTGEKLFACDVCSYRTIYKDQLREHKRIHSGEKPIACDVCGYRTVRPSSLKIHMKTHVKTQTLSSVKPYACDECEYRTASMWNLKLHKRTHTGEKPYACDVCDFRTSYERSLQFHMNTHTGEKPFACDICDFRSRELRRLKVHKLKHTGEKPYACDECEFRTADQGTLSKHMKLHAGVKPFACDFCEYKVGGRRNLLRHIMTIHKGVSRLPM